MRPSVPTRPDDRVRIAAATAAHTAQARTSGVLAYVVAKIRRRGIAMALWGWFLDLCVIGLLIALGLGVVQLAGF